MTHGSLFSGIGGFDLAAEWTGWTNVFHCEINEFCTRILNHHFPNAEHYADITKTDFTPWRWRIDVLSGGFPCQPFSLAGQRKGAGDDRYLWPQMLRAIREIQPSWVVGENVAGILTMVQPGEEVEVGSQTSLFGEADRKRVLLRQEYVVETICRDLGSEGYSVQPFLIPACAVGAPHRRGRVWFVAHRNGDRCREWTDKQGSINRCEGTPDNSDGSKNGASANPDGDRCTPCTASGRIEGCRRKYFPQQEERGNEAERINGLDGLPRIAADSYGKRQKYGNDQRPERRNKPDERFKTQYSSSIWEKFPTQSPVRGGDDGISGGLDGITFPKWRQESIKAYGNAVVPQVVYEIFKAIQETYE